MTALAIDPRHRLPVRDVQASTPGSPTDTRAQILSAWSSGPGVIVLSGAAGAGKTALLEQLAASLGEAGQPVRFARRGDQATLPDGPAILLVDEAGRMADALLRRLSAHGRLFGVLADRPDFVDRLRSIGLAFPVVHLGCLAGAAQPPPRLPWLRLPWLRRRPAAVAAGVGALLVLASAWVLLPARNAATSPPLQLAAAAQSPAPSQASPFALTAPPTSPPLTSPPPVPTAPVAADAPASPSPDAQSATPAAAATETAVPVDPPAGAIPTVAISYAANNPMAALLATELTERLRKADIAVGDPIPAARTDKPTVRYYFASDRATAEATRNRTGNMLAGLPVELAQAGPATRPGQIDIALGDGRSGTVPAGYEALVRARRFSNALDPR